MATDMVFEVMSGEVCSSGSGDGCDIYDSMVVTGRHDARRTKWSSVLLLRVAEAP